MKNNRIAGKLEGLTDAPRTLTLLAAATALCLTAALSPTLMQPRQSGQHTPAPAKTTLTQIPLAAQGPVSAALGQHDAAYSAETTRSGLVFHSPGQQLDARFTAEGVTLNIGTSGVINQAQDQLGFELQSIGHGSNPGTLTRIEPVAPTADANRVSYVHPSLTEWYLNGPAGLEQGWTITKAPAGQGTAPLTLSLRLTGNLAGKAQLDHDALTFTGSPIAYRGLTAVDAAGKTIPAHLRLTGEQLLIEVADQEARYPLTIDPFIQQQKLTASDAAGSDYFGYSTALSADGYTLALGAPGKKNNTGTVYVFTRSGNTWTQVQELTASDAASGDAFADSVALSGDGQILAVGALGKNSYAGAAYVFTRSGNTWTQAQKLTASDAVGGDWFGWSTALSADGNVLVIGAPGRKTYTGAAYVYTRSANTFTQGQILTLTGHSQNYVLSFGFSAALSKDGSTIVVGSPGYSDTHIYRGAVSAYVRNGNVWDQTQVVVPGNHPDTSGYQFGTSTSLTADGQTLAVGAPNANNNTGIVYIFYRSGNTFPSGYQQDYTASDAASNDYFGYSTALSNDGNTLAVGAYGKYSGASGAGATYLFGYNGLIYVVPQKLTAGSDAASNDNFGWSTALSADGKTLAVGAYGKYSGAAAAAGAAYVFSPPTHPLTATVTVANQPYANSNATTITGCALNGVVGTDAVFCDFASATATFINAAIGNGKTVKITGLALSGSDAGNYTLPSTATSTGNITPKVLTASVTANNKLYDGNTNATLTGCNLSGTIGNDAVTCTYVGATAHFATAAAGNGTAVTATGLSLSGLDAGNYTAPATAPGSGNITPLTLSASVTAATRPYNGTTTATLSGCTLTGVIGSDNVSCNTSAATASFASPSVGTGIGVTASGLSLSGPAARNYTAPASVSSSGNITPASLSASVSVASKAWDGNTSATLTGCNLSGVIIPDAVTCDTRSATASFATSTVGNGKPVSISGLALSGAATGNYSLSPTATGSASITPPLAIIGFTATPTSYTWTSAAKVTLQANVSSLIPGNKPNGTVNFMDGGTIVATAVGLTNAGIARASVKLAPGSHSLTAVYAGDAQNAGNTSTVQGVSVAKAEQTTVTLSAGATTLGKGETTTLTASGGNTPGAWGLQLTGTTGTATCSLRGVTLRATGGSGTCSVTATRGESTYYNAATSAPLTITVTP